MQVDCKHVKNIKDLVEETETNFIRFHCKLGAQGEKVYLGLPQGYTEFSYEECCQHIPRKDWNMMMVTVPMGFLVIDTDKEEAYDRVMRFLEEKGNYDERCVTPSFRNVATGARYKRHFWFVLRLDELEEFDRYFPPKLGIGGVDIFYRGGRVSEFPTSQLIGAEMYDIHFSEVKELYEMMGGKLVELRVAPVPPPPQDVGVDLDTVGLLLSCLNKKRLKEYDAWLQLGMILHSIGASVEVWDSFSQTVDNYKRGECEQKWRTFATRRHTIGSLYFHAKNDNIKRYSEVMEKIAVAKVTAVGEQAITINTPFLLPREGEEATGEQWAFMEHVKDFEGNRKVMFLSSDYGTGKTTFIRQLVAESKKVLFITYRKTLSYDIKRCFKDLGFQNYLDTDCDNVYTADRLIVQLDSLLNVMYHSDEWKMEQRTIGRYDYIICDESEGLLHHLDGKTMEDKNNETYEFFDVLMKTTDKIICMDADLSCRSIDFFKEYGPYISIKNEYRRSVKNIRCTGDRTLWTDNLKMEIEGYGSNKFRIAVASQSETEALALEDALKDHYPHLKMLTVTGSSKADKEKQEIFLDINTRLQDVNIFIYSPTLECGVDIQVPVDSVYGICADKGNSQRAFLQMIGRCRNVANPVLYIWLDNLPINNCYNFWEYHEVAVEFKPDTSNVALKVEGGYITTTIKHKKLHANSIHNKVEDLNKHRCLYVNYLKTLAMKKGYTFEVLVKERKQRQKTAGRKLDWIVEAEDITQQHYSHLVEKERKGEATTDESRLIRKHHFKNLLAVDELDRDTLRPFLYNEKLIYNFECLLDDRNIAETEDFKAQELKEKLRIVRQMVKRLGYDSIVDTRQLDVEALRANFFDMIKSMDLMKLGVLFGKGKRLRFTAETTTKQLLGFVNSIMNEFCVGVRCIKKNVKKGGKVTKELSYLLSIENEVDEIIRRQHARGLKTWDRSNLLRLPPLSEVEFLGPDNC